MSKISIEFGISRGRVSALHEAQPMFSVEATPTTSSVVVTTAGQANQGLDGVVRIANGSSAVYVAIGDNPNAAQHPRRYVGAFDTFEGILKQGQTVAVMLAASDY